MVCQTYSVAVNRMMHKHITQMENELKLKMLHALADSQRAIATIMEQVSQIVVVSEPAAHHVLQHIHMLTAYQKALAEKMGLIQMRQISYGQVGQPWLAEDVKIQSPKQY